MHSPFFFWLLTRTASVCTTSKRVTAARQRHLSKRSMAATLNNTTALAQSLFCTVLFLPRYQRSKAFTWVYKTLRSTSCLTIGPRRTLVRAPERWERRPDLASVKVVRLPESPAPEWIGWARSSSWGCPARCQLSPSLRRLQLCSIGLATRASASFRAHFSF